MMKLIAKKSLMNSNEEIHQREAVCGLGEHK